MDDANVVAESDDTRVGTHSCASRNSGGAVTSRATNVGVPDAQLRVPTPRSAYWKRSEAKDLRWHGGIAANLFFSIFNS